MADMRDLLDVPTHANEAPQLRALLHSVAMLATVHPRGLQLLPIAPGVLVKVAEELFGHPQLGSSDIVLARCTYLLSICAERPGELADSPDALLWLLSFASKCRQAQGAVAPHGLVICIGAAQLLLHTCWAVILSGG
eukprot:TRINITY_DN2507_c0_g1_i1.p3 TRINITY_DN2507_c0_g1~~TRINITY_DN2507_c0_g1_i1.p3  ORF type:complete len:137 (+),score=23.22 TRINITY_DN2507_c0_g1_i1:991-1401(+)